MRLSQRGLVAAGAVLSLVAGACSAGGHHAAAADSQQVQDAVRRSIDAENRGDAKAFLAHWTDDGLRSYDAGSRSDIQSGKAPLGVERTDVRAFVSTAVKGGTATTTLDGRVEMGVYRERFDLVRKSGKWLINGFQFLGPAPPPAGTPLVDVKAVEYAYDIDAASPALTSGDFAVHFVNAGQEQHEITLLAVPPDAGVAQQVLDLGTIRGADLSSLPAGYSALGHLAYSQPGEDTKYTVAQKLPPGRYAMACFLPVGGVNQLGGANQSDADSHVARGMIANFTVK